MATTETRSLTVHPAILHSIIKSQAGSLSKALLEAVMNAVDAGATKCALTVASDKFTVSDNGKGFASRDEILSFFEQFGNPHSEGDATYGRYRMGRGQLFAFARNLWSTGNFQMDVDIQAKGLDYDLREVKKAVKGCQIDGTLYEKLEPWALQECVTEVAKFVAYVNIPVTLNGKLVSKDPAKQKWDIETDDAYIKLTAGQAMSVYNLGVLVKDYGTYQTGSGGIVVSKTALQVNFARNDILQHSCMVWRRIRDAVRKHAGVKVAKKASLNDSERQFLANQVTAAPEGELPWEQWKEVGKAFIVPTVAGRNASMIQLLAAHVVCEVPEQHLRMGERLHRGKVIFGVTKEALDRFGVSTAGELVNLVKERAPSYLTRSVPRVAPFEDYLQSVNFGMLSIPENEYDPLERVAMAVLIEANRKFFGAWLPKLEEPRLGRALRLGESDAALAWTDGKNSIHVERKFLSKCVRKGANGWLQLLNVLLHEYCHDTPDLKGHEHDQNFFELFEDLACASNSPLGDCLLFAVSEFNKRAVESGVKLKAQVLRMTSHRLKEAGDTSEQAQALAAKLAPVVKVEPYPTVEDSEGQLGFVF